MPSGGPRTPANPAMVSGPGALSQRTDGGPGNDRQPIRVAPGGAYGDRQAMIEQQQAARVPQQGERRIGVDGSPQMRARMGAPMGDTPNQAWTGPALNAPSQRPGEPVTHGSPMGAGPGPEALTGAPAARTGPGPMAALLMQFGGGATTGALAALLQTATQQGQ